MIITVVALPAAAYGEAADSKALFESVAPRFQEIPGLQRKYFVRGDHSGGVYVWEDRAAAERYLDEAWSARMATSYGGRPLVTYLDVPCVVDNGTGDITFPDLEPN